MNQIVKTNDGSYTLFSEKYNQTYHSRHGAISESEHVFLKASGFNDLLHRQKQISILEIGFGCALNFILTAQKALQQNISLFYQSTENDPLKATILSDVINNTFRDRSEFIFSFLEWYTKVDLESQHINHRYDYGKIKLDIFYGNALDLKTAENQYNAVYLDAFSPENNPELWTEKFFKKLFDVLKPGCKISTYSAKSMVRKNLQNAGFKVQKVPGPPGKREMIIATK